MKKLLSILLALVLATGLFAACSGSGSGSQAAGSAASGSGAAAAPDGKKTDLLLWLPPFAAGDDGALDKEFWTETLAPWAAENNVDLTIEITPWGNYEEKYLTGFSSGEGPDVGYMYLEMFNDFIEMGALEPLDAYITDADRENYLYLDKGFIKGKQYTMPFIVGNARILYFNMDILEQAGVTELPATWQDLVDVAVKIKEAGLPGVMPFAGEWADPAIGALNNLYYPYLWQAGGDIYNEDGSKVALMDNDAAVKAARFLYDLKFKYGVLPEESMALVGTEVRNQFIEGNIAIASMDPRHMDRLRRAHHEQRVPEQGAGRQPHQIHHQRRGHGEIPHRDRSLPAHHQGRGVQRRRALQRDVRGRRAPAHAARRQRRVQGDGHPV